VPKILSSDQRKLSGGGSIGTMLYAANQCWWSLGWLTEAWKWIKAQVHCFSTQVVMIKYFLNPEKKFLQTLLFTKFCFFLQIWNKSSGSNKFGTKHHAYILSSFWNIAIFAYPILGVPEVVVEGCTTCTCLQNVFG